MKIDIIGAGPAGLYFAILAKKRFPRAHIDVVERNAADDSFGFGIVLSDETLSNLKRADEPSYRAIKANFAYWDDIYVHFKNTVSKSSGHGFSGIRRITLLNILQARAQELGVQVRYRTEDGGIDSHLDADLVVAADGINSAVRTTWQHHFQPKVDLRSNRFTWLGARMTLPGFTYSFRENQHGIWNLHAYQYTGSQADAAAGAESACTLVVETTNETFLKSGLKEQDEAATAVYVADLFKDVLQGAPVLTNRSMWRQFPTITCKTWHRQVGKTSVVLLGDAAHTAHFSIGSGTKLALEDAIALDDAIAVSPNLPAAMQTYQQARAEEASRIQHSANVSLGWFEHVARFWHFDPRQFNISLLTRSKQITYENLRLRDPAIVDEITDWWNRDQAQALGLALPKAVEPARLPPLFAPFRLRELWLANRVVVSPMAQYSAVDGTPNDWHLMHYGARATGGAGLVFVEMTCPSADARITPGCTGMYRPEHVAAWRRIADFVHAHSDARIAMQLGHAGRKGSTQLGWEHMDMPLAQGNWPLISASPLPYRAGVNQTPREMRRADMDRLIEQFCNAAIMSDQAGFDLLELHMAHGYLLASFLSPITNTRTDEYGGSLAKRMRFPLELFAAVRAVWPQHKPMSVRLSATDWIAGGNTGDDAVQMARAFKAAGCDLIDVSTGQTDPASKPVYGRMFQATFAEQVRNEVGIATMAVGAITNADQINTLLVSGRADLVALARPHLANPNFTLHAAAEAGFEGVSWPVQYLNGATQLMATSRRTREDLAKRLAQARESHHD
jgi:anthraniloyl-CoA monooxygenase